MIILIQRLRIPGGQKLDGKDEGTESTLDVQQIFEHRAPPAIIARLRNIMIVDSGVARKEKVSSGCAEVRVLVERH